MIDLSVWLKKIGKKSLKRCSTARINLILSSIKETRLHRILSLRKENVKSLSMEKLRKLSNMEIVLVNLLCCMALRDQHPWRRWAYAVFGQLIEIHLKKQLQMLFIGNTLKIVRSLKRLSSSVINLFIFELIDWQYFNFFLNNFLKWKDSMTSDQKDSIANVLIT